MGPSKLPEGSTTLPYDDSFEITNSRKAEPMQRKLTRKEKRAFDRKMKKPKYQKIAKRIIDQKSKKDEQE